MSIPIDRAFRAINLEQYHELNRPEEVVDLPDVEIPSERVYVLRMLIKDTFSEFLLPQELMWVGPIVAIGQAHQELMGVAHSFCYITIRSGIVDSVDDDVWHVDGFSTGITHLPEQNYIWVSNCGTEYAIKKITFPSDFCPRKHNLHLYLQDKVQESEALQMHPNKVYCVDPYVIHRRPKVTQGTQRTFVRVSFCPIEIMDVNNTPNPLLPRTYTRDSVISFRNTLERYVLNET